MSNLQMLKGFSKGVTRNAATMLYSIGAACASIGAASSILIGEYMASLWLSAMTIAFAYLVHACKDLTT